ncbi:M23 family peptidase, partial [Streptomyces sp. NPDC057654]
MASNKPALDEPMYDAQYEYEYEPTRALPFEPSYGLASGIGTVEADPVPDADADADTDADIAADFEADLEADPEEGPAGPVRGKHRVGKQRGGTMARSGAVLGVGVIAAVGAGGMASAQDRPAPPISVPDLAHLADQMGELPGKLPGIGSLVADDSAPETAE